MRILIEKNNFYSNYLRCQQLGKHLPYDVSFQDEKSFIDMNEEDVKDVDLVLFQTPYGAKFYPKGPKYVWDLDDVLENDEIHSPDQVEDIIIQMRRCFEVCDGVIFGSKALYERYKKWYSGKYTIIDDYIDPCDHKVTNKPLNDGKVRIGFMGSGMYKTEVEALIPIMKKLKKKYSIEFIVIGVDGARPALLEAGFKHIPYNPNYSEFQYLLCDQHLDIGVIYQTQREVMQAKNYLKFGEFAWFGIPVVASDWITGKYVPNTLFRPFDDLNGCYEALEGLILNQERQKLGKNAQKFIKNNFSLHDRVKDYERFFKEVL